MATFAVVSVSSLVCQASTCFRIGSKLRCIRSTPTEMQSMSEIDFECFANTGVNSPGQCFHLLRVGSRNVTFAQGLFDWARTGNEDVHESPGALLPVGTGGHVGDANQRAE